VRIQIVLCALGLIVAGLYASVLLSTAPEPASAGYMTIGIAVGFACAAWLGRWKGR
jgi:hypothetical protein